MSKSHEEIKLGFNDIKKDTLAISEEYFDKLSISLISYYNMVIAISENTNITTSEKNKKLKELYSKYQPDTIEILLQMLEEVYLNTSLKIKNIYEFDNDKELPKSKITFYNKDGQTIEDRLNKYFNPINENTFIKRKESALNKMRQITKSESLNEMNIVEYDKLFNLSSSYEIYNEDDEADCDNNVSCESYWGIYSSLEEPPDMPSYHPDCECHVAYYI